MAKPNRRDDDERDEDEREDDRGDLEELLREIREEQATMRQRFEDLQRAATPAQRRRAEAGVRESERGLEKALREHGFGDLSEDDLRDLRRQRQRSEWDAWFEEKVAERAEEEKPKRGGGKKSGKGKSAKTDEDEADDEKPARRGGYF